MAAAYNNATFLHSQLFIDSLDDVELRKKIEETRNFVMFLKRENRFLDKYIRENKDDDLENCGNCAVKSDDENDASVSSEIIRRWSCSSSSSEINHAVENSFSPEEKYELIVRELKHLRGSFRDVYQNYKKLNYIQKLQLNEVESRKKELIKDQNLFEAIVVLNGVHPITGVIRRELVEKYFQLSFKAKDLEIERAKLSKQTLTNQDKKLKELLKDEITMYIPTKADCEKMSLDNEKLRAVLKNKNAQLIQNRNQLSDVHESLKKIKIKLRAIEREKYTTTHNYNSAILVYAKEI